MGTSEINFLSENSLLLTIVQCAAECVSHTLGDFPSSWRIVGRDKDGYSGGLSGRNSDNCPS